jgi:hypothetical protein
MTVVGSIDSNDPSFPLDLCLEKKYLRFQILCYCKVISIFVKTNNKEKSCPNFYGFVHLQSNGVF